MFTPIKNFLTYIQKNASGSTLFGGSPPSQPSQALIPTLSSEKETVATITFSEATERPIEIEKLSEMNGRLKSIEELDETFIMDEEEDIETRISCSTMINTIRNLPANAIITEAMESSDDMEKHRDHNLNDKETARLERGIASDSNIGSVDDPLELTDYRSVEINVDDRNFEVYPELKSEIGAENEDMEAEEIFPTTISFPDREVIVLEDPDPISSFAADMCTEDPLAIEEFDAAVLNGNEQNPLDSSTEGEILWISIDTIKRNAIAQSEPSPHELLSPKSNSDKTSTAGNQLLANGEEQEVPSDGSDSGLGSETSAILQTTVASITDTSITSPNVNMSASGTGVEDASASQAHTIVALKTHDLLTEELPAASIASRTAKPLTSLKRSLRPNLKRHINDDNTQTQKRRKRSINFDNVEVFYFPRIQGFTCVPSVGGCTLGMGPHHVAFKTLTLAEHAAEIRRAHRLQLQETNPRGSSTDDSDSDEELSEGSGSDLDADSNGFLQPVSPKQRRVLLKAAGIRKIDASEKAECRDIRNSREFCGCSCRDFCDPDTCACSQAGIKCQVDRILFPCGCSRDACGNVIGRVEFNPSRVRTHFIHTIMRLDMESRQQQKRPTDSLDLIGGYSSVPMDSISVGDNNSTNVNSFNTMPSFGNLDASQVMPYTQHQHNPYTASGTGMYAPTGMLDTPPDTGHIHNYNAAIEASHHLQQHYQYRDTMTAVTTDNYIDSPMFSTTSATPSYVELLPAYTSPSAGTKVTNLPAASVAASYNKDSSSSDFSVTNASSLPASSFSYSGALQQQNITPSFPATPSLSPYDTRGETESVVNANFSSSTITTSDDFKSPPYNYICLNTPASSSSRISAINDLLLNNRNTTAALVAVASNSLSDSSSIDRLSVDDVQKSLAFNDIVPAVHQSTIVFPAPASSSALNIDANELIISKNEVNLLQLENKNTVTIVEVSNQAAETVSEKEDNAVCAVKLFEEEQPPEKLTKLEEPASSVDNLSESVPTPTATAVAETLPSSIAVIEMKST